MTAQPIAVKVTRHKCPFCPRTATRPVRAREHMARCWFNPEVRGCKTCKHFELWHDACGCEPGCNWGGQPTPEHCAVGVDLTGRPACEPCRGTGDVCEIDVFDSEFEHPTGVCPACDGDASEVKPGPIVHCEKWEAA